MILISRSEDTLTYLTGSISVPSAGTVSVTDAQRATLTNDPQFTADLNSGTVVISDGVTEYAQSSARAYLTSLLGTSVQVAGYAPNLTPPAQQPFASPLYRTKVTGIPQAVACPAGQDTNIDFLITDSSIFATGGEIIVQNALFGDRITAEIYDLNGVIPAPYRAATSEAWPVVARYIINAYVRISQVAGYLVLDTRPLAAQIPQGTSMRITYHATTEGVDRLCAVNYFLNKKLPGVSSV